MSDINLRRRTSPTGPARADKWDEHKFAREARQPGEQAEVLDHRRRQRPGRRVGGRDARRARLQGEAPHLPRLAPPGAQHRGAGRHQRGQELPQRRRQHPSPLLRHGQGRRLPGPGSQRLPARAGQREHHRPVRRRRACPSPASTAACSTTGRSAAPRSRRTFYARGQTGQQLLLGAYQALARQIAPRQRRRCTTAPRCSTWSSTTAAPSASSPAT